MPRRDVVGLVRQWIAAKRPAAVVRLGEGEGRLLVADASDDASMDVARRKLKRQTGIRFRNRDILAIKRTLERALDNADIVGILADASFNEEHLAWQQRIEEIARQRCSGPPGERYITHCLVSGNLRDALPELLAGHDRLSLVTSRNLQARFEQEYSITDVKLYQIPSQYIMRDVDDEFEARLHGVPIWPEFCLELYRSIRVREAGEVFIVGAGVFGKGLCIEIREQGGIALDLGSTLDGLAHKPTRGPNKPPPYRPVAR